MTNGCQTYIPMVTNSLKLNPFTPRAARHVATLPSRCQYWNDHALIAPSKLHRKLQVATIGSPENAACFYSRGARDSLV